MSFICEGIHHATVADIARLEGISLEDAAAGADKLAAVKAEPKANPGDDDSDADVNLKFDEFDIVGVLDTAAPLLASKVGDFDASTADDAKLTKKERLRLAKQALKERLGMAVKDDGDTSVKREEGTRALDVTKFVDVDDLVGEDDVEEKAAVKVEENRVDAADLSQLSARERNRLKRKQKRAARDDAEGAAAAAPASKKAKKGGEDAALAAAEAAEEEEEAAEVEAGAWPLTRTCESLAYSLFAARWEERHGAAAALREILRHHADAAAVLKPPARTTSLPPSTAALAAKSNGAWLEDMAVRLLCLLSLDRFGDYVGDGVVAPVRETGAQALGAGLLPLPPRRSRLSCARCWCCCGGASGRCDTRRFSRCDTCSRRGTHSRRGSFPRLYRRRSPRWTTRTTTSGAPRRRLSFPRLGTFPRTRISPSCSARCGAC